MLLTRTACLDKVAGKPLGSMGKQTREGGWYDSWLVRLVSWLQE